MESGLALEGIAEMRAGWDKVRAGVDAMTLPELLEAMSQMEQLTRELPALSHGILARLQREASPVALGATSWRDVLTGRLRISGADARRRLDEAADLGPRVALSGEQLTPTLPKTAAAQASGSIGAEHVAIIRATMDKLPGWVDLTTREQAEVTLVRAAIGLDPDALRKVAARLLALIDQDGPEPDATDRARRRGLWIGPQGTDAMTPIKGNLDPQARATLEAIFAKWAAPGMCHPDDAEPCTSGTPTQAQIDSDTRLVGQRNHDALIALGRSVLSSGELGQHNGLPVTIVVTTTLNELESGCGQAVTAGGTLLPMAEVIRMASHAHHYLTIFDRHTEIPLYLGRTKRLASPGQRIVLYGLERGCTFPGCHVPAYGTQVHHAERDWTDGGLTDITDETLACGPHNRLVTAGGWRTRKRADGRTEWFPPPELDTGQTRINDYHHPERLLAEPDGHDSG